MPNPRRVSPLRPLLDAFCDARPATREVGGRERSVRAAVAWLTAEFLDAARPDDLIERLTEFYRGVVPFAWHGSAVGGGLTLLRHGLAHLLRGRDPLPERYARCAAPGGAYSVAGLGPAFWSAVVKALDPDRYPDLTASVLRGLHRLDLAPADPRQPGDRLAAAIRAYDQLLGERPGLTACDLDTFFTAAAGMTGRELGTVRGEPHEPVDVAYLLRSVRSRTSLRKRSSGFAERIAEATSRLGTAGTPGELVAALTAAGLPSPPSMPGEADVAAAVVARDRVQHPDDLARLDPLGPDALWLLSALLHLRQPNRFPVWSEAARRALAVLDDAADPAWPPLVQYRLLVGVASELRRRFRVHPAEVEPLLAAVAETSAESADAEHLRPSSGPRFGGFSADTFRFLDGLAGNNQTDWMAGRRDRYRFAVREPMVELCAALADRYVRPVLGGEYGWELETDPRPGRALTSICKNDFGRGGPYQPVLWLTFYRQAAGKKRDDVQLFVRVDSGGVSAGFHLGPGARNAGRRFRRNVQEHGELLFSAVRATGAVEHCRFGTDAHPAGGKKLRSAADLRAWAAGKELFASHATPAGAAVLRSDDLVGEVLILFDRLVPLFAAAVEDDPRPILAARAGTPDGKPAFDRVAFRAATFLSDLWLTRALDLLRLKKQLILQGVPGTGKTHVARSLARLLTADRAENVRLVQFHPGYSYEEFVEGLRPKPSGDGYAVEPGLLASFAERAARHPSEPHVLLIDEVNRGNLPRVFGELLFLLEYRDQGVTLPYSKVPFRLPENLYLIATMNPADRSAVGLDQAVRRRFSFVDMPPDPAVLARWLDAHPPADDDPTLAPRLVRWFEDLNRRLERDVGPDRTIGHSFFMLADLTADQLRTVWEHHVRPALAASFPGGVPRVYDIERLLLPSPTHRKPAGGRRR